MTQFEKLTAVAAECEKYPVHDLVIFGRAFDALYGPKPERVPGGSKELTVWLNKFNPFYKLCDAGGFLDAAMMLSRGIPWLSPVIDYPNGTVILVNGLGLPVGGKDYKSRAETIPLAILASWLKAHAHIAGHDSGELESFVQIETTIKSDDIIKKEILEDMFGKHQIKE